MRMALAAIMVAGWGMAAWAQAPGAATTEPAAASATAPATSPATSPSGVSERLFGGPGKSDTTVVPIPPATQDTGGPGTVEPVGPNAPKVKMVLEGTILNKRVVRLSRDEKAGVYLVTFDADGKEMRDPPMIVLPSKTLAAMEELSQKGTRAVRFQITGEVTEYKGKNYILIHNALALRDLNTGLGGG